MAANRFFKNKKIQLRNLYNNLKICPLSKNGNGQIFRDFFYWEFDVQPTSLNKKYKILLVQHKKRISPYVFLLDKEILNWPKEYRLKIPHLYDSDRLRLCLYHPRLNEWQWEKLYCTTIIPWIYLWIIFFEYWLYSSCWEGGGEHPPKDSSKKNAEKKKNINGKKISQKGKKKNFEEEIFKIYEERRKKYLKMV